MYFGAETSSGVYDGAGHGPPVRTANVAHLVRVHFHQTRPLYWKRLILGALMLVDEFFCGRFHRICDLRAQLENRWSDFV